MAFEKQRLKTRERNYRSKNLFEQSELFLRQIRSKSFSCFALRHFWLTALRVNSLDFLVLLPARSAGGYQDKSTMDK
jgi:hypothetical protein